MGQSRAGGSSTENFADRCIPFQAKLSVVLGVHSCYSRPALLLMLSDTSLPSCALELDHGLQACLCGTSEC